MDHVDPFISAMATAEDVFMGEIAVENSTKQLLDDPIGDNTDQDVLHATVAIKFFEAKLSSAQKTVTELKQHREDVRAHMDSVSRFGSAVGSTVIEEMRLDAYRFIQQTGGVDALCTIPSRPSTVRTTSKSIPHDNLSKEYPDHVDFLVQVEASHTSTQGKGHLLQCEKDYAERQLRDHKNELSIAKKRMADMIDVEQHNVSLASVHEQSRDAITQQEDRLEKLRRGEINALKQENRVANRDIQEKWSNERYQFQDDIASRDREIKNLQMQLSNTERSQEVAVATAKREAFVSDDQLTRYLQDQNKLLQDRLTEALNVTQGHTHSLASEKHDHADTRRKLDLSRSKLEHANEQLEELTNEHRELIEAQKKTCEQVESLQATARALKSTLEDHRCNIIPSLHRQAHALRQRLEKSHDDENELIAKSDRLTKEVIILENAKLTTEEEVVRDLRTKMINANAEITELYSSIAAKTQDREILHRVLCLIKPDLSLRRCLSNFQAAEFPERISFHSIRIHARPTRPLQQLWTQSADALRAFNTTGTFERLYFQAVCDHSAEEMLVTIEAYLVDDISRTVISPDHAVLLMQTCRVLIHRLSQDSDADALGIVAIRTIELMLCGGVELADMELERMESAIFDHCDTESGPVIMRALFDWLEKVVRKPGRTSYSLIPFLLDNATNHARAFLRPADDDPWVFELVASTEGLYVVDLAREVIYLVSWRDIQWRFDVGPASSHTFFFDVVPGPAQPPFRQVQILDHGKVGMWMADFMQGQEEHLWRMECGILDNDEQW
ncbi:unnamed protein product [Zymoseptoria tritici ST99CH_1E4]|uniref:Uncharacterized protein n=1 Tax=Zymoseptoria tritici ST99CH_1E4 TaxID=1276532 RepID=A0A2H1GZ41_ZYMTR|nr:unnamed protein product [Zymoseptoria tritici ST99CH_1E4]